MRTALFWCISAKAQADLFLYHFKKYGEKLDIPTPPQTSKAVWEVVKLESLQEIDRLVRQPPSRSRGNDD